MAENRPEYRDSRIPRSVKVYTIAQESRHLIIKNIPAISGEEEIIQDLLNKCWIYGQVKEWKLLDNHPCEEGKKKKDTFTNILYIQYSTIDQSRLAKNKLSGYVFYANLLQVSYAPEYDSVDDLRLKFQNRQSSVYKRLQQLAKGNHKYKSHHQQQYKNKRKQPYNNIMVKEEDHHHHQQQPQQQQQFLMISKLPPANTSSISHSEHSDNNATKSISQSSKSINKKQRRRI